MRRVAGLGLSLLVLASVPSAAHAAASVVTFGRNQSGQLGAPPSAANPNQGVVTPTVVTIPDASGAVSQAAAGNDFTLALTATGQIFAFGSNDYGQLGSEQGTGTTNAYPVPQPVAIPAGVGTPTAVAAGDDTAYALTSAGVVLAWGNNEYGQLGTSTGDGTDFFHAQPAPQVVGFPGATGPVTQIAAGAASALALTATGQVYAWGSNSAGTLGTSTNLGTQNPNPTPDDVAMPSGSPPVVKIAAGTAESMAITAGGQLYAWGDYPGEADGSTGANPTPTAVSLPGAAGGITQVAGGGHFTLALTGSGQLFGYGDNESGQLGTTTGEGAFGQNPAVQIPLGPLAGQVAGIGAGDEASELTTRSGQLDTFGGNYYGELGRDTGGPGSSATPGPVALPPQTTVQSTGAGGDAPFAVVVPAPPPAAAPGGPTRGRRGRRARLTVTSVRSSGPEVVVALRCRDRPCRARITVDAPARRHRRAAVLARRSVHVRAGHRATVRVGLSAAGRRLLRRRRRLTVAVRVAPGPTRARRVVVHLRRPAGPRTERGERRPVRAPLTGDPAQAATADSAWSTGTLVIPTASATGG